jgi:hypothetical protein
MFENEARSASSSVVGCGPWQGHNRGYSASREQAMADFKARFGATQ